MTLHAAPVADPQAVPTVSIGLPVYNGERYIRGALEMLARQSWRDYELVIIDNGSRDGTAAICREFADRDPRIRYVRFDDTVPLVDNFWRAFTHAHGRYFLWNAADDSRPPSAIADAVAVLNARPDVAMVHGPVEVEMATDGRLEVVQNDVEADGIDPVTRVVNFTRHIRHNASLYGLYRREALQRGVFRQHVGQDFLLCLQLALIGPIAYAPRPLIRYLHANGPIDDPMYRHVPLALADLLAYPRHRFKCIEVLWRGMGYLLRERGTSVTTRLQAVVAFAATFGRRFRRHLASELLLLLAAPIAWSLWPLTCWLRKRRRRQMAPAAMKTL